MAEIGTRLILSSPCLCRISAGNHRPERPGDAQGGRKPAPSVTPLHARGATSRGRCSPCMNVKDAVSGQVVVRVFSSHLRDVWLDAGNLAPRPTLSDGGNLLPVAAVHSAMPLCQCRTRSKHVVSSDPPMLVPITARLMTFVRTYRALSSPYQLGGAHRTPASPDHRRWRPAPCMSCKCPSNRWEALAIIHTFRTGLVPTNRQALRRA